MKQFTYTIKDELGIHARPAGLLVKAAKTYTSKIEIAANGKSSEATKLMALMGLGIKCGQTIEVTVTGEDEEAACAGIQSFLAEHL